MGVLRQWFGKCKQIGQVSYAQGGEDLLLDCALLGMGITQPRYLDLGTHHPMALNNTYLFYRRGCQGVCVEPNPELCAQIKKRRPRDLCVNAGISTHNEDLADFYVLVPPVLSTFSRVEAQQRTASGQHKIKQVLQVPLIAFNDLLQKHMPNGPQLVSLDIEGLDLEVLQGFDFKRFRPEVWCIETLTYRTDGTEQKIAAISEWMSARGYFAYADTYINTIFVEANAWRRRKGGA
jgi:FkbM family methyltransferase